ncbi:alpha/beta hydrolase [Halomonas garicola]|uniref:alpha/beta hydrolase n=1 Tax=Halomonas garicola TaxID=1690008 RepID=UPI0028A0DA2B|nr:alpha/beta hydrolase [Halomonas garicola]
MFWLYLTLAALAGLAAVAALATRLTFRLKDLSALDRQAYAVRQQSPGPENQRVRELVEQAHGVAKSRAGKAGIVALRDHMDALSDDLVLHSALRLQETPKGEWMVAPEADTRRRVLYLHGGGWTAGSPRSHRAITDRLSRATRAAVFAVDYRLMPEHRFMDGVKDCREAYRWLLDNGPEGAAEAEFMLVAGDSAGGSHTLGLLAWLRDSGLRQADGAVAFSPSTDLTLTAPSNRRNIATDWLLGPMFGRFARLPRPLVWWAVLALFRVSPTHPQASPLRGRLAGLPPTLIQASADEMLVDNARRYAARATAEGSPVTLQLWPGMVHVWQIFAPLLPEADEAFAEVAAFVAQMEAKQA